MLIDGRAGERRQTNQRSGEDMYPSSPRVTEELRAITG